MTTEQLEGLTRDPDPRALLPGICGERRVLGGVQMICVADEHPDTDPPDVFHTTMARRRSRSEQHFMVAEYPTGTEVGLPLIGPTLGRCVACEAPAVAMVDDGTEPGRRWPMCGWHRGDR